MRAKVNNYYQTPFFIVGESNVIALQAYAKDRRETGGFLRAMLEGDIYRAILIADISNQQRIYHIAKYISETMPEGSYGSKEKVAKWINRK